jgi:tRNA (guanine37-N1)-methyltransferase
MVEKINQRGFDFFGNVALVKFNEGISEGEKKKFASDLIKKNPSIKTVLEKVGNFSGRLRKLKSKFVLGEDTKEVLYKEKGCSFRFNIDETYFSPRLANERQELASLIKKGKKVFVMFAGVAPFSIVIAKNSKAKIVFSNELNKKANDYARMNLKLNKVGEKVILLDGDVKKVVKKLGEEKFDVIVMPRPQLKDTFLEQAFMVSKKGAIIYYYDFCKDDEAAFIVEKIKKQAETFGKKIKILNAKSAGEIAPYKIRLRVDFKVLN